MRRWMDLHIACVVVSSLVLIGCDQGARPKSPSHVEKSEVVLSEHERVVKDALCEIARVESAGQHDPMGCFMAKARELLQSQPSDLDRRMILRSFRSDVLSLTLERREEKASKSKEGALCRPFDCLLNQAYFAVMIRPLLSAQLEFEDLVFEFEMGRRIEAEESSPSGKEYCQWSFAGSPFDLWMDGAFYREGSDMYVYWQKASHKDRAKVLEWFVGQGGRRPDWVR